MKNREISEALRAAADLMELLEIQWKPRAYRAAAGKIESMDGSVESIYREKGRKGLESIPSVGSALADHIAEYIEKGRVEKWEKLKKKSSGGIRELINIQGLGPKKAREMSVKLGIKNLADLKKAVSGKKIRELEGFGEKSEKKIAESIRQYERGLERALIGKAWDIAHETMDYLRNNARVSRIDYGGSLRRMQETIGDIDLLAVTGSPEELMDAFSKMPPVSRVLLKGRTKTSVFLKEGLQVDLRVVEEKSYGAALQYFTGNKEHNIALRKIAALKGYKLSEYGLHKKDGGEMVAGRDEEGIYKKLEMDWISPELRENTGELESAAEGSLPRLIDPGDVRGDLQMHTNYSDGYDTVLEMARKAEELGYDYIAVTDHSKSERIANGMDEIDIRKQWREIEKAGESVSIKIMKGAEVDILPDGSLDYDDAILKELDIVLAAVHSRFNSPPEEMTERILTALDNEYVDIFAHPTGRRLNKREGYRADFDRIFKKCAGNNVAVEINCDPERLDLNGRMIMRAKKHGVKFSLGTDAHSAGTLPNMRFGVGQARRGWLLKEDAVNTMSSEKLREFFSR